MEKTPTNNWGPHQARNNRRARLCLFLFQEPIMGLKEDESKWESFFTRLKIGQRFSMAWKHAGCPNTN